jgi:hypothetical protein
MKVLNIRDLETTEVHGDFLRVPSLSLGLYRHEVDASVPQEPHTKDEVHFVASGHAEEGTKCDFAATGCFGSNCMRIDVTPFLAAKAN